MFNYSENHTAGSSLGTVATSDTSSVADYRFSATGTSISADGFFAINNSGVISLTSAGAAVGAATNDFEIGANTFNLGVQAIDASGNVSLATNVTLNVTNVNEAPIVAPGAAITSDEDQSYIFNWSDFKVSDIDNNSTLSVQIESIPLEGKLQFRDSNGVWTDISSATTVSKAVIDAGGLRFVPESNESGNDSFSSTGVGINKQTYAEFQYSGSDGALSSNPSSTMNIDITPIADVPTLSVRSAAATQVFNTGWETAANSNITSELISGPTLENWTLVTTGDLLLGGTNVFEVWHNNDAQTNQAGTAVTINMAAGNGNNALELNDAGEQTPYVIPQTLGITRSVATEAGKVYELSLDYAGRLGYDASFTKIAVYLGNTLVGEYASTSSQTSLNWENIHFSFVGTGNTENLTIKLAGTSTELGGRGALIDDITLSSSLGVIASSGGVSGKTSIALANYISGNLTDTDGSETLRYDLRNLPSDASIVVGNTTLSAVDGVISLTAAQLATATLQINSTERGQIGLDITAVSIEPNGSTASTSSQHLDLKIVDGGVSHESFTTNTVNMGSTTTALGSGLTGEYFGYNEAGGQSNLISLTQVENYIESRTGNNSSLVGSNNNASTASLNASFVANQINFGLQNNSPIFSDDLGDNRSVSSGTTIGTSSDAKNNLYDFLTAAGTSNVSNLIAGGAGLGDTSDAIIRGHGYLDLSQGGTYDIRVTADDGYSLMIGGQVVAQADYIQSTASKVYANINLSGELQAVDLLYWDQGGAASLKVEFKLSGSADSTYKVLGSSGLELYQAPANGQELVQTATGWALHTIETVTGTDASDLINGGNYSDIINGGIGHDVLYGNGGSDLLNGGDGNDLILGGIGNDTLTGGIGADTFMWKAGNLGNDIIKDFKSTEGDRIDLSDLLPDAANTGDITQYLQVDTLTSTLKISTTGALNTGGSADVTIKLEDGSGGNLNLSGLGSTSTQIVNSLIAGSDPIVKVDHS